MQLRRQSSWKKNIFASRIWLLMRLASQKRMQQSKAEYLSMKSRLDAAAAQLLILGVDARSLQTKGIQPYLEIKAPLKRLCHEHERERRKNISM